MTKSKWTWLLHVWRLGGIAILAACSDGNPTAAMRVDALEETQAVRVRVHTELALLQITGPGRMHRRTRPGMQSLLRLSPASLRAQTSHEPRTIVKHFRQADGKTLSLGWYFKANAELPTLVYVFANGRIQSVVGLAYTRHGNGYLRRKARVTTFDSTGTAQGQINVVSEPTRVATARVPNHGVVSLMQSITADVLSVILPRELHAEEKPCTSEYLSYLAASAKLAAATAAVQVAAAACVGTGVSCPVAGAAAIVWLEMLDKWNLALDKLLACTEAAKQSTPDGSGSEGGSSGEDPFADDYDAFGDFDERKKVQEFIDDSIRAGTFTCSSDGDVCTYYAE